MNVLIAGAGVIGCYLAHVLCQAGQDVTLLARGAWMRQLQGEGLTIRHELQRHTTVDHPRVIDAIDGRHYDAVFAVMQHQQMHAVLDDLALADTPVVVLVGNNMSAPEMEARIMERTATPKTVLFGFQGTGGRRESGKVIVVRFGAGSMSIGGLHGDVQAPARDAVSALFSGTDYRLTWVPDMDAWYKCHLALVLPAANLCYALGCNLRRSTRAQRRQLLDAAREGYALLREVGCAILPPGEDRYYEPGARRAVMAAMILVMAKTVIGDLAAADHCRHAVSEMEGLDAAFEALRVQKRDFPMPNWDALRAARPDWEALHSQYEGGLSDGQTR